MATSHRVKTIAVLANVVGSGIASLLFTRYIGAQYSAGSLAIFGSASNLLGIATLAAISITATVGRHILQAIHRGQSERASKLAATAIWVGTGLAALAAVLLFAASPTTFDVLKIPFADRRDAAIMFGAMLAAMVVLQVRSTLQAAYFRADRMDLLNLVSLAETLLRVTVTVALAAALGTSLAYLGLGSLAAAILTTIVVVVAWRRIMPDISLRPSQVDRTELRFLSGFGGWLLVDQVGILAATQLDLVFVTSLAPRTEADCYAAAVSVVYMVRFLLGSIAANSNPELAALHAKGEDLQAQEVAEGAASRLAMIGALPIGAILGLGPYLFASWIGPAFSNAWIPAAIGAVTLIAIGPQNVWFGVANAMNRVRAASISGVIAGLLGLGIGVLWLRESPAETWRVAAAIAIALIVRGLWFAVGYLPKLDVRPQKSLAYLPAAFGWTILSSAIFWGLSAIPTDSELLPLAVKLTVGSAIYAGVAIAFLRFTPSKKNLADSVR